MDATIEIPSGATVGATYTATFPAQVQGALFFWDGRGGGTKISARASHQRGIGFWAPNGQGFTHSASTDGVVSAETVSGGGDGQAVFIATGGRVAQGAASCSVAWDGSVATLTLTVTTAFAQALTVGIKAFSGLTTGMHYVHAEIFPEMVLAGMAGRPDFLILSARAAASNNLLYVTDSTFMVSVAARNGGATQQALVVSASNHANDPTRTRRWASQDGVLLRVISAAVNVVSAPASVTSWNSDGATITASGGTSSGHVRGLAGIGCQAQVLTGTTKATTTPFSLSPGFPVGDGIVLSHGSTLSVGDTLQFDDVQVLGTFDGDLTQHAVGVADADAQTTTQVSTAYDPGAVYVRPGLDANGTMGGAMKVTARSGTDVTFAMQTPEADSVERWFAALLIEDMSAAGGGENVAPVASITAPHGLSSTTLPVGGSITLTGTITDVEDGTIAGTWDSSNDAIATVAGGLVTAVAEGIAVISYAGTDSGGLPDTGTHVVTVSNTGGGGSSGFQRARFLITTLGGSL